VNTLSHPHSRRRHARRGRRQFIVLFLVATVIVLLVAGLVWFLSSPRFARPF
jgi:cell division septal protein FtsQ